MIDLTPLEVRQKKGDFRRAFRGYHRDLVNDFLDLVADRLEGLVRENMALTERVEQIEADLKRFREREEALQQALVTAQETRSQMEAQARKESALIIREAENAAAELRAGAGEAREREEEALRRLRARRGQLVRSYRTFLERELAELAVIAESLELEDNAGPRAAAGRAASGDSDSGRARVAAGGTGGGGEAAEDTSTAAGERE